ncbi:MAG: hypothetical protein KI785_12630 [Devosiaceae bacterium]|nr:hypothetical protein [Devosiaceae bacterium MH13]
MVDSSPPAHPPRDPLGPDLSVGEAPGAGASGPPNVLPVVSRAGRLSDALRRARARQLENEAAEGSVRTAAMGLLTADLSHLAAELDGLDGGAVGQFELVQSVSGDRLVIDPISFVELAADDQTYRLIRQRREGAQTVFESTDRGAMADAVADYMADRIVERENLEQPVAPPALAEPQKPRLAGQRKAGADGAVTLADIAGQAAKASDRPARGSSGWGHFWSFVVGALFSAGALLAYAWLSYPAP